MPVYRTHAVSVALYRRPRRQRPWGRCHIRTVLLRGTDDGADGVAARDTAGIADDIRQSRREFRADCHEGVRHLAAAHYGSAYCADGDDCHRRVLLSERRAPNRSDQDVHPALLGETEVARTRDSRGGVL